MSKEGHGGKFWQQILLVILGAFIALFSSRFTQYWQYNDQRAELVNHIRGSVQDDVKVIDQWIEMLKPYLDNPDQRILSAHSFRWQHEQTFLKAVANRAGILDLSVVEKLNKYFGMIEQSKAFRKIAQESLLSNSGDVKKSNRELRAYFEVLKGQKSVGEELLELLRKTYP